MSRHLAIGDIHGCFVALRTLEVYLEFQPDDTIITLGDYVDRGPKSKSVIDWLIEAEKKYNLVPLRGNHELMMLDARHGGISYDNWMYVGGNATLKSYASADAKEGSISDVPESHWEFLENQLLPYYETETHLFVHANAYPDLPLSDQPDYMLYWEKYDDPPMHESGKVMVCGHSSQKNGWPITNGNAICIDTWACGDGWLTCLDVNAGKFWQADNLGEVVQFHLDELE